MQWAVVEAPVLPSPPGTAYAGVGVRFLAFILDLISLFILAGVFYGPVLGDFVSAISAAMPARPSVGRNVYPELQAAMAEAMTSAAPGFIRASALFQLGGLFYLGGSWLAFSRTPAMALLGLRIVREEDGGRLNIARVAVRYGCYLLSAAPLLLGFAWALFDGRKQAWHDKLAGTVVVRPAPQVVFRTTPGATPWPSPYEPQPAPGRVDPVAPVDPAEPLPMPHKRPSVGGVAETALQTFLRSPLDLLASLAVVLIPTMVVLLPLIAAYLIVAQDQVVVSMQLIGDTFNTSGDFQANYAQIIENNRRVLAAGAPSVYLGVVAGLIGSVAGSLLIGACAAAVDDAGSIRPAGTVTKLLAARLPALLVLGVAAGLLVALEVFVLGLPSLSAVSADPATFNSTGASLGAVLIACVAAPLSLYFGAVWLLAVVCVVREGLGAPDAFRSAWRLSRGRMRWLAGISIGGALAIYSVIGPVGLLPLGLLAEQYISGVRLPVAMAVITLGLLTMLTWPLLGLTYVAAFRAARDDASAVSAA